ncbi:MAG: SDR family oxidoreductase [Planctomycetaceae bacterium]
MIDGFADRWALITGASSGIGAEFAHKLAARGMHLVLTARRLDRLEKLATELHTRHGTHCETIAADLSEPGQVKHLVEEIERRERTIEILVNNAGFAVVGDIASTDVDRVMELVRLNVGAVTELTYRLLPGMLERGHGAIINVSSVAAIQPVAYMSAYAASKSYVLHFSEALWAEARDQGVTIMALCPGVTETEFFDVAGVPGWLKKQQSQTPDQVVRKALKALDKKRPYVIPGWKNYLRSLLVRIASRKRVVIESMKYFRPKKKKDKGKAKDIEQSPDTGSDETGGSES